MDDLTMEEQAELITSDGQDSAIGDQLEHLASGRIRTSQGFVTVCCRNRSALCGPDRNGCSIGC